MSSRTISSVRNIEGVVGVETTPAVIPNINDLIRSLIESGSVSAGDITVDTPTAAATAVEAIAIAAEVVEDVIRPTGTAGPRVRKTKTAPVAQVIGVAPVAVAPVAEPAKVEEPKKASFEPPAPFERAIDPTIFDFGRVEFYAPMRNDVYTQVVIVGCGGTGSRLIPLIAQHVANHNEAISQGRPAYFRRAMRLVLIDMDVVELKNLKRQNFYKFDIGKNKAHALAERFSALNGIDIEAHGSTFDEAKSNLQIGAGHNFVVFDCTDNAVARKSIEDSDISGTLISCGNEDVFGQVLISSLDPKNSRVKKLMDGLQTACNVIDRRDYKYVHKTQLLPTLLEIYKNFTDSGTASCAEIAVDEQSMPVNSLVAQLAYNVFYDISGGRPLTYHMVKCNVNNSYNTHYITNPFEYRKLLMKALFGHTSEESLLINKQIQADYQMIMRSKYAEFSTYIDKYGIYMLPYIHVYMQNSYYITSEEQIALSKRLEVLVAETARLAA